MEGSLAVDITHVLQRKIHQYTALLIVSYPFGRAMTIHASKCRIATSLVSKKRPEIPPVGYTYMIAAGRLSDVGVRCGSKGASQAVAVLPSEVTSSDG